MIRCTSVITVLGVVTAVICLVSVIGLAPCGGAAILSPEQAIQNVKNWAGDSGLDLQIVTVNEFDEYIIATPNGDQRFCVDGQSGNITHWIDKAKRDVAATASFPASTLLSNAELRTIAEQFLAARCPYFNTRNLQLFRPDGPPVEYTQILQNGVHFFLCAASCEMNPWTGEIYGYTFLPNDLPSVSTDYTMTAQQAEQIAIGHVWSLSGPNDEGNVVHPQSVFLWKNRGVVLHNVQGIWHLAWWVECAVSAETGYTKADFEAKLRSEGECDNLVRLLIDANTGEVLDEDPSVFEFYHAPPAATPMLSLQSGTYSGAQTVVVSCTTEGSTIRYTTDGSDPAPTAIAHPAPLTITVNQSLTLKARAYAPEHRASLLKTAQYTIE